MPNYPYQIRARDFQLADVVSRVGQGVNGAFDDCVVKKIEEVEFPITGKHKFATLFRPYAHTADFSYTGGVICYIGIEEFTVPMNGEYWLLHFRKELR